MKVVDALMTILILAGILTSGTTAREQFVSVNGLIYIVEVSSDIYNTKNLAGTLTTIQSEVERYMTRVCQANGGPTAYNTLKEAWRNFEYCFESVVNTDELAAHWRAGLSNWTMPFKERCRKLPSVMQCIDRISDSVKSCADKNGQKTVDGIQDMIRSFLELICEGDPNRITSFFNTDGLKCLNSKQYALLNCARSGRSYNDQLGNQQGVGSLFSQSGPEECGTIEAFKTCTVGIMQQCENPTPANVIESVLDFYKSGTPCKNFVSSQAAATTSVMILWFIPFYLFGIKASG